MHKNSIYLILSLVLLTLAVSAIYIFFWPRHQPLINDVLPPHPTPSIVKIQPSIIPTIVVNSQPFTSNVDKFSISYSLNRKLYQDKEVSGNRYTLYSPTGNIAIHVGKTWSWSNPQRVFSSAVTVDGQPTFVFDIANQIITDFQYSGLNFTVQCVHNGDANIKSECQQLLKEFKFL